jgi:hypothetical protein
MDRAVNASLVMADTHMGKKSDGSVCFVFGKFVLFLIFILNRVTPNFLQLG